MAKIQMTTTAYDEIVQAAKTINERTESPDVQDKARKYLMRTDIPTPAEFEAHHLGKNFGAYLPFVIYYLEPGICVIPPSDPDFKTKKRVLKDTRRYLMRMFEENVDLIYDDEEE